MDLQFFLAKHRKSSTCMISWFTNILYLHAILWFQWLATYFGYWRTILVNFRHFVGFSSFTESTFTNEFFFRTKSELNGSFGDIKILLVSRREVNDNKKRPKLELWSWITLINGKKCSSFLSTLAVKVILNLGSIKIWIMMKKETRLEYKPQAHVPTSLYFRRYYWQEMKKRCKTRRVCVARKTSNLRINLAVS